MYEKSVMAVVTQWQANLMRVNPENIRERAHHLITDDPDPGKSPLTSLSKH